MPTYLTPSEVADLLRVKPSTLATWRKRKVGPPYVHLERAVRYERDDVVAWIDDRKAVTA